MNNINPSLTPAMQAYLIALIYRNTRSSCLSLASICSALSHDALNRCLHSSFPWSRRLWELLASRMIHEGGYLVLDDTTWQRQTKVAEAVAKVWSSSAGGVRRCARTVGAFHISPRLICIIHRKAERREGGFKVTLRVNILSYLEGELLDSVGLDYSREAEEEGEPSSVLFYRITQQNLCQTKAIWVTVSGKVVGNKKHNMLFF